MVVLYRESNYPSPRTSGKSLSRMVEQLRPSPFSRALRTVLPLLCRERATIESKCVNAKRYTSQYYYTIEILKYL